LGCDGPQPSDGLFGGWTTCGDGRITWRMHLGSGAGLRLTKETSLGLTFSTFDGSGAETRVSCTSDVDCVIITPEPATIALVASGLAGVAALKARRRKKLTADSAES
jgi:hypothetical protein